MQEVHGRPGHGHQEPGVERLVPVGRGPRRPGRPPRGWSSRGSSRSRPSGKRLDPVLGLPPPERPQAGPEPRKYSVTFMPPCLAARKWPSSWSMTITMRQATTMSRSTCPVATASGHDRRRRRPPARRRAGAATSPAAPAPGRRRRARRRRRRGRASVVLMPCLPAGHDPGGQPAGGGVGVEHVVDRAAVRRARPRRSGRGWRPPPRRWPTR